MLKKLPPEILFGKIERDYGILIRIEINASLVNSQYLRNDIEKLYFEILLTEKYPFQPPQVYCKTKIGYPTIDDKRDVLEEVIQKEWSPNMTIFETIQRIPDFVSDILQQMAQDDEIRSIGKWHLGQSYHITDWGVGFFRVREEKETLDGFQYHDRYIAVCENSFFLFEPDLKGKDMAKLLSVATLWSLEKIIRNLDMPEYVTFVWRKLEHQKEQWVLKVEIHNTVEWINLIVKYLKTLEISVQKKYEKKRKILASEVNDKALKKTDANELRKQVEEAEQAVENNVTHKTVKALMDSYQKAIEYYSALDNKLYEDFLNRMTNLFKREEVQKALAQPEEESTPEGPGKISTEDVGPPAPGEPPVAETNKTTNSPRGSEEAKKEEVDKTST